MALLLVQLFAPTVPDPFVGWCAVLTAIMAFGSFAAPAKTTTVVAANVHPLVYQTYKSFWCFATSWLVLLIPGVTFTYTPYALLSALFWVPGGWMAIASVQYAGLAISQATWSSFIVMVSFVSGIAVFHEPVQSWPVAASGLLGMVVSITGMAFFTDPARAQARRAAALLAVAAAGDDAARVATEGDAGGGLAAPQHQLVHPQQTLPLSVKRVPLLASSGEIRSDGEASDSPALPAESIGPRGGFPAASINDNGLETTAAASASSALCCCCPRPSDRWIGFALAVGCGLWGGSLPTPLKLAERATPNVPVGFSFVTSFGVSVAIVTALVWVCYLTVAVYGLGHRWPSLQPRVMFFPGMIAGLAWSTGNIASILAVTHLGEALGYSACQASLVVSGLWGIVFFREVDGCDALIWMCFALLCAASLVMLGMQMHAKDPHQHGNASAAVLGS